MDLLDGNILLRGSFDDGTLAERIRAGIAGIHAFYTPTAVSTLVHEGGAPIKYGPNKKIDIASQTRESKMFNNREYILKEAITGDFSLVNAYKADKLGNLVFRKTARNFNPPICKASRITIAEVEEIVEVGELDPEQIDVPDLHRLVQGEKYEKRSERMTLKKMDEMKGGDGVDAIVRERIIRRAATEFRRAEEMHANRALGLPWWPVLVFFKGYVQRCNRALGF
ncbi:succinyl-CoA:3-ketoacid coenzyme A transferase 1, mitochondrial-like [Paramacrobiotus metropolitanus]|uniref:succinyl-CoA:3-ketoacid coenzyme A transferase 1, mitochondrial-like n=1 Tax=Paramacrobiotus metropolitanus TaxID=2943436 RepID=UPI002445C1FC|nr:succinyl-CoA:3-ketoacid coenzyme A transferase 1, mitochondrial-like [Paramacrobiotus metropolitanus]